jgi:hypothetical protein
MLRRSQTKGWALALWLLIASVFAPLSFANKAELTESQAKLAIIYNFISRYVKWPGDMAIDRTSTVNICVIGKDELTREIDLLKRASNAKMQVNVLHNVSASKLATCHVAYIAQSEHKNIVGILAALRNAPVLTFSSVDSFAADGGMIALIREMQMQGTFEKIFIRYEVNTGSVSTAKLYIDPDALELARKVIQP